MNNDETRTALSAANGQDFAALFGRVKKPARYLGGEWNVIRKPWDAVDLRMVLAFPDLYEVGMSHQGLQILYHVVNRRADLLAERVYAPDLDMEQLLRGRGLPLFSMESRRPLADFDILGITLPYELCFTNLLTILDLAGLPFKATDRGADLPLVIGGGPCAFHAEPVAEFFDAILLGDGEEAILEIADIVRDAKRAGATRREVLERLSRVAGVYVPRFFQPVYDGAGRFRAMEPLLPGYERVVKRVLPALAVADVSPTPLVPQVKIVHDRLGVEIARGCTRGCRFCQAGIIYRPVRERSAAQVLELAGQGIAAGGFEDMALLSLSSGDYSCLSEVMVELMDRLARDKVSVSMPSMRVGTLTPEIMEQIRRVRKTGFTLAPEAGTDRLRRVINKGITEADLLKTCQVAFGLGWKLLKLYFMFGLPTETPEDLAAIAELAQQARRLAPGGRGQINVSAATFVPKPHTPFQWEPQLSIQEGFAHIDFLKGRLRGRGVNLKWNDPRQSYLEGVMSRGDRRLAPVVIEAWRRGARLDGWSEHFDLGRWQEAGRACNVDLDAYLARRAMDAPLPWQHLEAGVGPDFFAEEYAKALQEAYTPDCRVHGCQKCGLCDFKTIRPVVHAAPWSKVEAADQAAVVAPPAGRRPRPESLPAGPKFVYRLDYARLGEARYLGHLELIQIFFRAFRRAGLPLIYSQGFHPTPNVSFSPALPVGTESLAEYLAVELNAPADCGTLLAQVNGQLPDTIRVRHVALGQGGGEGRIVTFYQITLADVFSPTLLEKFMQSEVVPVTLTRKGKRREMDVRPMVRRLTATSSKTLELELLGAAGQPGIKPMELLTAILHLSEDEVLAARVLKQRYDNLSEDN